MTIGETPAQILDIIGQLRTRLDKIQESVPELVDDYHRLFLYFIGQHFEELPPTRIKICDRQKDQKIDFYKVEENRFVAYQCKLPDLDKLEQKPHIEAFSADLVNEAEDVLTFLTDEAGTAKGNQEAQEARNRYRRAKQEAEEEFCLEVVIAYFGRLTPQAKDRLTELRKSWCKTDEIVITTRDYDDIVRDLDLSPSAAGHPKEITLNFSPATHVHTNQWAYGLVPAITFCKLFDEHKMGLFDLNVRYYLERSSVNRQIQATLMEDLGRKNFYLFNNGITISCKSWAFPTPKKAKGQQSSVGPVMTLRDPQIINGCQTVISIHKAYHQLDREYDRRHLEEHCLVPVRILQILQTRERDREILYQVVTASNNQNKMSPRNLHSNSREQRNLQKKFAHLKPAWFYERKDGEFYSFKEYPTRDFSLRDYQYGANGSSVRQVSNEDIAKAWLSFIGFSHLASENINAFDSVDDGGHYEWLFGRCPNDSQWNLITLGKQVELSEDNFEVGRTPEPEQYLLSYLILEFVKAYIPTPQANRKACIERLVRSRLVKDDDEIEDINKKLAEDETYVHNQILSNMKEVIVELFAWVFVKTYGPINGRTAKALLRLPGLSDLVSQPDFKAYVRELNQADPNEKLHNVLFTCTEFIRQSILRWQSVNQSRYLASQRRIRFLHLQSTIEQMKTSLEDTNASTRVFQEEWKPPKKAFLESLPRIAQ